MEIRAVVEALRTLPAGIHVVTDCGANHRKSGANGTMWQKLAEVTQQHMKLKSHGSILLNECADMLVTNEVKNEKNPPHGAQKLIVPAREDTNSEEYRTM
jgi:ribonuclease HI